MPTSPTSPYPPNCYYGNNKLEFVNAAQSSCGALEVNGLSGFGQQFSKSNNDTQQANGFLNGLGDHFQNGVPNEADPASDLLPGILSSLEINDFDNKKHGLTSSLGGGNSIWSDNVLFSPVLGNSNGSNNVSYGWGPPGSKVTSPQPWADSQTMKSTTFQDITSAVVSTIQKPLSPAHDVSVRPNFKLKIFKGKNDLKPPHGNEAVTMRK